MSKIAIVTDSNSGITQSIAKDLGVFVVPMPFYINEQPHFEDIDLTQEQFYSELKNNAKISTSQPAVGDILELWNNILKDYDEIVHIPMSSGLSGSCSTATMLAEDFDNKVHVVNNQRVSVTQRMSVLEARELASKGMSGKEIKELLEASKFDSSIYITLETLEYLKRGGRITPAAAALGTILKIKPVLQIQGEKLDAYAKVRNMKQAKNVMYEAMKKDCIERFGADESLSNIVIMMAYTENNVQAEGFREEINAIHPNHSIVINPLSLSISCHIGPGALAIACSKKIEGIDYSKLV